MGSLESDLRYALRTLVKNPGYAAIAIATLALGIGANSAIFSVVNGVVLKPLEYRAPGRLVMVHSAFPTMGFDKFWVSAPEYRELREWSQSFESLALYATGQASLRAGEDPIRVSAGYASAALFEVLGVEARLGRVYTEAEDLPGVEAVTVLSHELWQRYFGSDAGVVGRRVAVDGVSRTVVGVMPPRFDIDDHRVEIWIPLALDPNNYPGRASHNYYVVGRLGEGVPFEAASAELENLLSRWREEAGGSHAPNPEGHPMFLTELRDEVVGEARPALLMLLAVVGLVLLVASANVANLLLARAESRQREIAVRNAMGAGKLVLLRQFLVESILLALLGGVVGVLIAFWGVRLLFAAYPDSIPRAAEVLLDGNVLLFSLVVSLVTGVLFGVTPLLHLSATNLGISLKDGGQRSTASSGRQAFRRSLVVAEIAVAVMLVIGCGLLLRSFWEMQQVDPGFEPDGLSTFEIYLPETAYPQTSDQVAFFRDVSASLSSVPGVESATSMSGLPPRRRLNANDMQFEDLKPTPDGPPLNVDYWQFVTEGYFETMKIAIVAGRSFRPSDDGTASPVCIINETMAKVFWPDQDPLGRRVKPPDDSVPWFTIIGIAKDVKQAGLEEETGTEVYFFYPQTAAAVGFAPRSMNVVLRSSLPPRAVAENARRVVWERDASLPLAGLRTMDEVLVDSLTRPRFITLLLVVFAVLALALAAVGTYGVMSYFVAERTSEIGLRMALGAGTRRILKLVLSQGLLLGGIGVSLGIVLALVLTRLLGSFLFGVTTTDPTTFIVVPLVLLAVALVACFVPAMRAMRIEPVSALRHE
ncbi:MAG TPA: ABC transporter permease [Vicinamibacteria bacterium]|nr:ABC transporter permease [Vicinamibacteria bacterium]